MEVILLDNGNIIKRKIHGNSVEEWEYNSNNRILYYRVDGEVLESFIRDKNENIISYKSSIFSFECEYNELGKMTHYKDGKTECFYEYNDEGKEIHFRDSNGFEEWYEYSPEGKKIHHSTSTGIDEWFEYDKDQLINVRKTEELCNDGSVKSGRALVNRYCYKVLTPVIERDENGKALHVTTATGSEEWFKYDEQKRIIYYRNTIPVEVWIEYTKTCKIIKYKVNNFESVKEFNNLDQLTYIKDSTGFERHFNN